MSAGSTTQDNRTCVACDLAVSFAKEWDRSPRQEDDVSTCVRRTSMMFVCDHTCR